MILVPDPVTGALRITATTTCKSRFADNTSTLVSADGCPVQQLSSFGIDGLLTAARGNSCCQITSHI